MGKLFIFRKKNYDTYPAVTIGMVPRKWSENSPGQKGNIFKPYLVFIAYKIAAKLL